MVANPVRDAVHLSLNMPQEATITIALTDLQGRTIYKQKKQYNAGTHAIHMTDAQPMAAGNYILTVSDGTNTIAHKLVKQ